MMSAEPRAWPKMRPQTRMAPAAATMIHLRSNRSPKKESDQRPERRRERDHGRIAEAGRDGDPLLDQQRGHPIVEAVISDRLEDVEDAHQDDPAANARKPQIEKAARRRNRLLGAGRRQRPAVLRLDLRFDARSRPGRPRRASRAWRASAGFPAGPAAGRRRPARRARRSAPPSASPRARRARSARAVRRGTRRPARRRSRSPG